MGVAAKALSPVRGVARSTRAQTKMTPSLLVPFRTCNDAAEGSRQGHQCQRRKHLHLQEQWMLANVRYKASALGVKQAIYTWDRLRNTVYPYSSNITVPLRRFQYVKPKPVT